MVGLAGANHAYDCAADRLEPPPGRRGARAGRACREGVVFVGTMAPTSGRRGMGGPRDITSHVAICTVGMYD